jgi:hypothetical protein
MKNLVYIVLFISGISFSQNRNQLAIFGQYQAPVKSQMPMMNNNIGFGFNYGYKINEFFPMYLQFGYTHSYNSNYNVNRSAILNAGYLSNYTYKYKVNYNTYFNTYMLGAKFQTGNEYSLIRFFVTPQVGLVSFNSSVSAPDINNPFGSYSQMHSKNNDWDEDDIVYNSSRFQHTLCMAAGGQLGVEFSINEMLGKSQNMDNRLVISGNFLVGCNDFRYINLEHIRNVNVNAAATDILNLPTNNSINVTACTPINQSRLMMWGIQVGYIFVF